MRICHLYDRPEPTISFEFFPPKTLEGEETLFRETIPELLRLRPAFFSVTYGAGGGTRDNTLRIVSRIRREFGVEAMSHLTCVGSTAAMVSKYLDDAHAAGIENILALRGDPPQGQSEFQPVAGGFAHAIDLVRYIKQRGQFGIAAACYPEGHLECPHKHWDWDRAAAKVEAGAEVLITQLFYDWSDFLDMYDYLRNRRGLTVPIIPGVLPFLGTAQIKRFTTLCGAKLARPLLRKLEAHADDDEAVRQLGVEVCTDICRRLLDHGVAGIHFYCLNRTTSCAEIMRNLGLSAP
ncbi:MAG: methylenetetrahydrofolate reductase [NAD(P)H] [Gemmataceae bacterium]|nr:methylenetetrahydrofolate reductase [NAD(P)H] [Gemmataceae bacterium]